MERLTYLNSCSRPLANAQVADIATTSAQKNVRAGITGVLFYNGVNFLQTLEGPPEAVAALMERLHHDPRHAGIVVISRDAVTRREFPDWGMAFVSNEGVALPVGLAPDLESLYRRFLALGHNVTL